MDIIKEELCFRSFNQENTVVGYVYIPQTENFKGVLQIVHGMAEHFGRYDAFCNYMAEQGYIVCGHDQVGHGKTAIISENQGFFGEQQDGAETLVEDVRYLQLHMARRYRKVPYFLLGHSMGSFVARVYAAKYGSSLSGLILCGTGAGLGKFGGVARAVLVNDIRKNGASYRNEKFDRLGFGGYSRKIKNPNTTFDWLSRDEERVTDYVDDLDCGFVFTNNGYLTLLNIMAEANDKNTFFDFPKNLPILLISGDMDPVGDYGKGVHQVGTQFSQAGMNDVKEHLYSGGRHEMLQETNRDEVYTDIADWLDDVRKKRGW